MPGRDLDGDRIAGKLVQGEPAHDLDPGSLVLVRRDRALRNHVTAGACRSRTPLGDRAGRRDATAPPAPGGARPPREGFAVSRGLRSVKLCFLCFVGPDPFGKKVCQDELRETNCVIIGPPLHEGVLRANPWQVNNVAHDLFIHHFGSRTLTGAEIDANKLLSENGSKFAGKWGTASRHGRAVASLGGES